MSPKSGWELATFDEKLVAHVLWMLDGCERPRCGPVN